MPPAKPRSKSEGPKPDDDLMRRLVEAVEGQASRAKADQAARDADRERETRAVGAVLWALFGLAWLASEQQASISHFVTSNWGALPVLIPLFGIVAAFAYRAFRLRVFTVSLVFTVVAMVVLTEVYFMRGSNEVWARTLNVFLAYTGLYYFLSAGNLMTDDEASGRPSTASSRGDLGLPSACWCC